MSATESAGPYYDPPYDSPIEDLFVVNAIKYLHEDARLDKQVEVPTICGTYYLDFVATCGDQRMAVECDGRDFHDEYRDEWRDALILGAGAVDVIYRLRGCDLTYHVEDLLYLMSRFDPYFFSERGQINLRKLAADEVKPWGDEEFPLGAVVSYKPKPDEGHRGIRHIYVRRWYRKIPPGHRGLWWDWWRPARRFAPKCRNVEELMAIHEAWLQDLEAGRDSGDEPCEECGDTIPRRAIKAVWNEKIICYECYKKLYR